jgi:hypothetical protein
MPASVLSCDQKQVLIANGLVLSNTFLAALNVRPYLRTVMEGEDDKDARIHLRVFQTIDVERDHPRPKIPLHPSPL